MKKFVYTIITFLFVTLLIEASLQITSYVIKNNQNQSLIEQLGQSDKTLRILCIGESTTALGGMNSYPSQLEKYLNSKHPTQKFRVINGGLIGNQLEGILYHTKNILRNSKEEIHLVIGMMGINDIGVRSDFYIKPRTYQPREKKLEDYLIIYRIFKSLSFSSFFSYFSNLERKLNDKLSRFRPRASNIKKETVTKLIKRFQQVLDQDDLSRFRVLVREIIDSEHTHAKVLPIFQEVLSQVHLHPKFNHDNFEILLQESNRCLQNRLRKRNCLEIASIYLAQLFPITQQEGNSFLVTKKKIYHETLDGFLIELEKLEEDGDISHLTIALKLNLLWRKKRIDLILSFISKLISLPGALVNEHLIYFEYNEPNELPSQSYFVLKQLKENQLQHLYSLKSLQKICILLANKCEDPLLFGLAGKSLESDFKFNTFKSEFLAILSFFQKKNIKFAIATYPTQDSSFYEALVGDQVPIIDNSEPFNSLINQGLYEELFTDNFAFTFGHATRKGNQILAENIGRYILQMLTPNVKK